MQILKTYMQSYLYQDLYLLEEKHWWHLAKRRMVQDLIKTYNRVLHPKILDVGCGTGKNMESFGNLGEVWGIDKSKEAISFCRKRGLENVRLSSADNTKFPDNFFDIITILDVLEHTDDNKALKEGHRILKEGGLLILTVPAFTWLWSKWDEILHHKRRYDRNHLVNTLKNHNFSIIYVTYLYSFLVLPVLIIRQIKQKLFRKKKYPSDFNLSNKILNKVINLMSKIEFKIAQKISLPLGTTILVVAKK